MAAIVTNVGSSFLVFRFEDENGDVIASFRMNPGDVKLAQRFQEVSAFFREQSKIASEIATMEELVKYNDAVEEKMCFLLGYNARESLFGVVSATTILEDGNMFVVRIMEVIAENIKPELEKRKQAMAAAVSKHTAKYQ